MLSKSGFATIMPIKDMNRAIKFYTTKLGGRLQMRADGPMKDFWASVKVAGHNVWLVKPMKREKRTVAYSTFLVKDIRRTVKGLVAGGVKFDKAEPMGPESKVVGPIAFDPFGASAFFKDTEGNLLMLWQDMM
jgi:predicted enzyme related to lactoylglutathione lyase